MKILKNITHLVVMGIIATLFSSGALAIAPEYGGLVYLLRDLDGVPVPTSVPVQPDDPPAGCRQPLAFPENEGCDLVCDDEPCLVPLGSLCEIPVEYESCVREVEFGRISVSRSPEDIFTRQLCDVVATLDAADEIQLDPAGRLVGVTKVLDDQGIPVLDEEGEQVTEAKTIDSPLQNLAIYWLLMLNNGNLQINTDVLPEAVGLDACANVLNKEAIPLPNGPDSALITAARGLGAASDKGGKVDVDLIAYLNRILKLTEADPDLLLLPNDTLCEIYKVEDGDVLADDPECFLDYRSFGYDRYSNFSQLPYPAYIPEGDAKDGWFEYLWLWAAVDGTAEDGTENPSGHDLFYIKQGPIDTAVFPELDPDGIPIEGSFDPGEFGPNIAGFALAADDARAVINFMHEHPVPVDYETRVVIDDGNGSGTSTSTSSSSGGGCSVAGGNPATDLSLLAILLAALGYLGLGMTRRT